MDDYIEDLQTYIEEFWEYENCSSLYGEDGDG